MAKKNYSEEFRRDAIQLYRDTDGATVIAIAADLGTAHGSLTAWLKKAGIPIRRPATGSAPRSDSGETPEQEAARLRAEVAHLRIDIARSSYYAWLGAADTRAARAAADVELAEKIRAIHTDDNTYGRPRITAEINHGQPADTRVNHKRIARIMRANNIEGLRLRRKHRTTIAEPADTLAPDLLHRDFTATTPNTRYVGDIT